MRAVLFHNVVADTVDPFDRAVERAPVNRFARDLDFLAARYDIVGLDDSLNEGDGAHRARPRLVLTFDDGFAGVHDVAWPLLRARGLTATVFLLTCHDYLIAHDHLLHFERFEIAFRATAIDFLDVTLVPGGPFDLTSVPARV